MRLGTHAQACGTHATVPAASTKCTKALGTHVHDSAGAWYASAAVWYPSKPQSDPRSSRESNTEGAWTWRERAIKGEEPEAIM